MRLQKVIIQNYRNLENVSVPFERFSALVGPNNIGKSSILRSLEYVFSQTNSRNVQVSKSDFLDPSKSIMIDVIMGEIDNDDAAVFYHDDGIINPINKTIRVRFVSTWSSIEQDVHNECYFVRDDLPANLERATDFYSNYKLAVPFFLISSDRFASQEIGLTKNRDLGRVLRIYSSDYLKPLATLRADILTTCKKIDDEKANWVGFPDDNFTVLVNGIEEIITLINNDFGQQLTRETTASYMEQLVRFSDNWPTISYPLVEFISENLEKPYIKLLQVVLEKPPILVKRAKVQLSLYELRAGILEERQFEEMNMGFKAVFDEMLPNQKLGLSLFSIQDDDLISQVSVDFDERSILANGSGYQSMFVIGLKLVRILAQLRFSESMSVRNFVIAIEEPENHLHPHMQRHFISFMKKIQALWLTEGYQLQIIITTHSPSIICRYKPSELIHLKREGGIVQANKWGDDTLNGVVQARETDISKHGDFQQQLERCLEIFLEQYADVFFSNLVIVVEGDSEEGAVPIWASKLLKPFDFDQLGVCFLNTKGDRMKFYLSILEAFHLDYVVLYDSSDNHGIEWVDKARRFPTQEKAFEGSVIASANIINVIEALIEIEHQASTTRRISDIRQRIISFSNITDWEDVIARLKSNSVSKEDVKKLQGEIFKWLSKRKSLILGRSIAKHTNESEIPGNIKSMFSYSRALINSKLGKTM